MNTDFSRSCPTDEVMAAFIDKRLSQAEDNRMIEHVNACDRCSSWLAGTIATMRALPEDEPPVRERLIPRRRLLLIALLCFAAAAFVAFIGFASR